MNRTAKHTFWNQYWDLELVPLGKMQLLTPGHTSTKSLGRENWSWPWTKYIQKPVCSQVERSACSKRGWHQRSTVFSVLPKMCWQETGFSQPKRKSAGDYVSADSRRSQLLSSDSGDQADPESFPCGAAGTKGTASSQPNFKKSRLKDRASRQAETTVLQKPIELDLRRPAIYYCLFVSCSTVKL